MAASRGNSLIAQPTSTAPRHSCLSRYPRVCPNGSRGQARHYLSFILLFDSSMIISRTKEVRASTRAMA